MNEKSTIEKLWEKYNKTKDHETRNDLLMEYVPLVKKVVNRLYNSSRSYNEYEDLVSCGVLGLMDAFDRFDSSKGASFETYAQIRIRGEIIDYMRSLDWAPVQTRIKIKKVANAYSELSQVESRMVNDNEVAEHLGMSTNELQDIQRQAHFLNIVQLEDLLHETSNQNIGYIDGNEIQDELEKEDFKKHLQQEISKLNEKEQLVLSLYYVEELTLKEIGAVLKLTESRVCQIHSSIITKLRVRLKNHN